MALTLTFLGHAGFLFADGNHTLCIDPFLTGNELAKHKPDDVKCQHLAFTHAHQDHFNDDGITIAKRNSAAVYAPFELANHCQSKHGLDNVTPTNPGGGAKTPFGHLHYTQAFHSSSIDGQYMGAACGIVVKMGGKTVYHLGDTGLFSDLKLIGEHYKPDVALVPIGGGFTMGPELASRAAELVGAKVAVPIHYRTFPALTQDASAFKPAGVEVKVMDPGDTAEF